jgi:hypothetical protein
MKNGRPTLYPDTMPIRLLTEKNEARPKTKSHKTFETARRSETIGEYREAGGNLRYLYWHAGRGKIAIG